MNNKSQESKLNQLIVAYEHQLSNAKLLHDIEFEKIDDTICQFYKISHNTLTNIRNCLIKKDFESANNQIMAVKLPNNQSSVVKNVIKYYIYSKIY